MILKIDNDTQKSPAALGLKPFTRTMPHTPDKASWGLSAEPDRDAACFGRPSPEACGAPFWLLAMGRDRQSQRQYLSAQEKKRLSKLEARWIQSLSEASAPFMAEWSLKRKGAPTLQDWQRLANGLAGAAGFDAPRVVYQSELKGGRGQFLFRVEGHLIQLAPHAAGAVDDWVATVAHETFHHFQQALIVTLYKGSYLPDPHAQLAAYYRDARNGYKALSPACPWEAHRRQDLERGAWAYGALIKARFLKSLSDT